MHGLKVEKAQEKLFLFHNVNLTYCPETQKMPPFSRRRHFPTSSTILTGKPRLCVSSMIFLLRSAKTRSTSSFGVCIVSFFKVTNSLHVLKIALLYTFSPLTVRHYTVARVSNRSFMTLHYLDRFLSKSLQIG